MIVRQLGAIVVGLFVFFATIAAMSRLLSMKEFPGYITNTFEAYGNLFKGAFGR